jgi:hypothetical protein
VVQDPSSRNHDLRWVRGGMSRKKVLLLNMTSPSGTVYIYIYIYKYISPFRNKSTRHCVIRLQLRLRRRLRRRLALTLALAWAEIFCKNKSRGRHPAGTIIYEYCRPPRMYHNSTTSSIINCQVTGKIPEVCTVHI